jgi:4-amino-4-deoxy-L-arabinose transferase-like glycosyltransferase
MPTWTRGFRGRLAIVAGAALAIRLVHALAIAPASAGVEDAFWFSQVAQSLADGDGFTIFSGNPLAGQAELRATAEHPPLYPLLLALAIKLGITGDEALRALGSLPGALTVVLIGLIARRIAGDAVGLLAASIAAAYPLLIAADGALLAETIYAPLVAGAVLTALHTIERPTPARAALLGALTGLAILTRSEAVLLVPLLLAPVAWLASERRATTLAIATLVAALAVAPWVIRNATTYDRPLLTTNAGGVLAQTNCERAYRGDDLGYLVPACRSERRPGEDEAESDDRWRDEGLDYARDNAGRVPAAAAVRVLRAWGLWQPFRGREEQGRSANVMRLGIVAYYPVLVLAVIGAVQLWRARRRELFVLLAPIALATLTALASYGSIRLRAPADLSLIVLAAAALLVQDRAEPHDRRAL